MKIVFSYLTYSSLSLFVLYHGLLKLALSVIHKETLRRNYAKMACIIYGERPNFNDLMTEITKIEVKINGKWQHILPFTVKKKSHPYFLHNIFQNPIVSKWMLSID